MAKKPKQKTVLAWHVLPREKWLMYGIHTAVEVGKPLSAHGNLKMCRNGLHAATTEKMARHWFKIAHPYSKRGYMCRVRLSGKIIGPKKSKYCARTRTVISMKKIR
jgi:hypothetical protein